MEAQSLYNLGTIYTLLGNYELAHESFTASLSILKIIKFSRGAAYVYSGMGDAYFASAEQIDAEKYYGRAVKIFSGLTNEEEYLWSVLNLSKLQYTIGEFKEAHDSLESIVDNPNIQRNYKFESLIYLGACEVEMGEIEPGLARINEGLDSLKSLILYSQTVEAHRIMGEIMLDLGRKDEARQHLEEGQAMADKSGMKGELRMYRELINRLKEL
jgi:tetratricopeptide (TPR) repeat protein